MNQGDREQGEFSPAAYEFLLRAIEKTRRELGRHGHVSGTELLAGIEHLGAEQFGPLAALVFKEWGVESGGDFGRMVEELVEKGVLFKKDEDTIEDFLHGRPFARLFEEEYFKSDKP
jgi:uncharacterized repeat protein (TIGR04138 family)